MGGSQMNDLTTLDPHSLTAEQFTALARWGGGADAAGQLGASQRSKHLILLAKVADLARRGGRPDDGLGVAGAQLLDRGQQQAKAAADEVIGYPSVGAWALHTIRGAQAIPGEPEMPGARPSGLAAVAAVAAVKARL